MQRALKDHLTVHVSSQKLSVVVISLGRPDCLDDMIRSLAGQTRAPDHIVFVVTEPADVSPSLRASNAAEIIVTTKGTCHQRNVGIDAVAHDSGIVAFFDDDYVPAPDALAGIESAFNQFGTDVAGMSGHLIADGITGPGISFAAANDLIRQHDAGVVAQPSAQRTFNVLKETIGLYGCNMAFRVDAIADTRFDEYLPLYAWQEDVDFAHRVARNSGGRMILTDAFSGVHRGVKNGRERRGARLGYSQVANNWYLWKNSHLPGRFALRVALRNVLANHAKMIGAEPWIDRRGRAFGNWMALRDIALGRVDPQRVHDM